MERVLSFERQEDGRILLQSNVGRIERGAYPEGHRPPPQVFSPQSQSLLCKGTNTVIKQCGEYYEVVHSQARVMKGFRTPNDTIGGKEKESEESIKKRATQRAQRRVRRLVNTNKLFCMCTLTFAPDISILDSRNGEVWKQINIEKTKDRSYVVGLWDNYRRKMKELLPDFPYICVIEKHTGKRARDATVKLGTYHVHYCTKKPPAFRGENFEAFIQRIWGHGLCNVTDWKTGRRTQDLGPIDAPPPDNPGAYLSKYFGQKDDLLTGREVNERRFFSSRGLKQETDIEPAQLDGVEMVKIHESKVEVNGSICIVSETYKRIN